MQQTKGKKISNHKNTLDKDSKVEQASSHSLNNLVIPILESLSWNKNYNKLFVIFKEIDKKLNKENLEYILIKFGYKLEELTSEVNTKLDTKNFPILLEGGKNHYQLIIKENGDGFTIFDAKLNKHYNSKVIPTAKKYYTFSKASNSKLSWYGNLLQPFNSIIRQLFITSFIANLFTLSMPLFIMVIYDKVIPSESYKILFQFLAGAMLCIICSGIMQFTRNNIFSYFSAKINKSLQNKVFTKLLSLAPAMIENASVSAQFAKFKDFSSIKQLLVNPAVLLILDLPFIAIAFGIIWLLNANLVLIPAFFFSLYVVLYFCLKNKIKLLESGSAINRDYQQSFIIESIYKLNAIKQNNKIPFWHNRYQKITEKQTESELKLNSVGAVLSVSSDFTMFVSGIIIASIGAVMVMDNRLSIGSLIAIMILSWRVLAPTKNLLSILPKIEQIKITLQQINKLINIDPEGATKANILNIIKGNIKFDRVSFRYGANPNPALLGASFNVNAGKISCIAGTSGSGKSTIIKLLARFYAPQAGLISIDGYNLQQLDPYQIRQLICFQPQNCQLFTTTIKENLLINNPNANQEAINQATILANVYDYIMHLPERFDTKLTIDLQNKLSKSFKQRLILARTYIKLTNLYVLDEPTQYFDDNNIDDFIINIKERNKSHKSTYLIVTNEEKILKNADQVIILENSSIAFRGNATDYAKYREQQRKQYVV